MANLGVSTAGVVPALRSRTTRDSARRAAPSWSGCGVYVGRDRSLGGGARVVGDLPVVRPAATSRATSFFFFLFGTHARLRRDYQARPAWPGSHDPLTDRAAAAGGERGGAWKRDGDGAGTLVGEPRPPSRGTGGARGGPFRRGVEPGQRALPEPGAGNCHELAGRPAVLIRRGYSPRASRSSPRAWRSQGAQGARDGADGEAPRTTRS